MSPFYLMLTPQIGQHGEVMLPVTWYPLEKG